MAQSTAHEQDIAETQAHASEWFLRTYPETTLGEMANYYRSVKSEVPLVRAEKAEYESFYERLTGESFERGATALQINQGIAKHKSGNVVIPFVAVGLLAVLIAAGVALYTQQVL